MRGSRARRSSAASPSSPSCTTSSPRIPRAGRSSSRAGRGWARTTLWEAGIDAARERPFRVLSARPSGAEAQLSFAALNDLLDEVDTEALAGVPSPQLRALEVALLRVEPADAPPEPHAIALGFLNALRGLAASGPLLVAIDDLQWLDPPSADVLAFAARRLERDPVGFLLTRRPRSSSPPRASARARGRGATRGRPAQPRRHAPGPFERLGLSLSRRVVRRIFESSLGNPLLALELGRTLAERGALEIGEDIPVSDLAEELLGMRLDGSGPRCAGCCSPSP